ncbi:hypothetical protein L838_3900 [Mycobacterium avium MAV_120709_2344]|nr:hypothetical protein L838_3900 [Mycobacterium avium MAV_120709_2344]
MVRHSALLSHLCSVGQADVVVRSARADGYMSTQCPRTVHARAAPAAPAGIDPDRARDKVWQLLNSS